MKDRVDKAVETLRGFCLKRVACDGCRFNDEAYGCLLIRNGQTIPADWEVPERKQGYAP